MSSLEGPPPRFNLLNLPILGRLLKWRWGRLVFQIFLLAIAVLMLYDGFTGPQFAPENLATTITWVQYRGLIVFGFLLVGNLFCMGCPFTLPRTLAKKVAIKGLRWPAFLRNKWLALAVLFFYFFLYEWLDLWASPLLTAYVIAGYFIASFVLEALFQESAFCKYVCPLGTFNFASSTISPTQITVADQDVCRTCVGRECVNGSTSVAGQPVAKGQRLLRLDEIEVLGCGTELYPPQMESNLDCTQCLDCVRACPHDNVVLAVRHPLRELMNDSWPKRWDISFMILIFAFAGLGNAFGMVPPVFALEVALGRLLNSETEAIPLLIIFGIIILVLPIALGTAAAWLSRALAGRDEPLNFTLARYAPAFAPLGFAIWLTHYGGFHFLSSALGIVPLTQFFLRDNGFPAGPPDWTLGPLVPLNWLDGIEFVFLLIGFAASYVVLIQRARLGTPRDKIAPQLPWLLLLIGLIAAALWIFALPMEMRGSGFMS